ncbi:MAG: sensor histidine kinase [Betaproteobacteria bacterium]
MAATTAPASTPAAALRWRQQEFARIFNVRTVAATFVVAALVAVWTSLYSWFAQDWSQAIAHTVYMTRQTLFSALFVLLAMAIAEATLPGSMPRLARGSAIVVMIALGAFGSTLVRLYFGRAGSSMQGLSLINWVLFVGVIWTLIGVIGYSVLAGLREADRHRLALEQARADEACLQAQMAEANLSALQAQIEPHFLFNTLANVRRLYEIDAGRGRSMLGHLVDYLRSALPSMRSSGSTLGRELDLIRSYLTILQLRMGERLRFAIDHGTASLAAELPPMVLPTLVENAIKHGLSALPEGGAVDVRALQQGDQLVVQVADTGAGFSGASGSGVGLANTRARLAALYGSGASLKLSDNTPRGVVAEIRVPHRMATAPSASGEFRA